LLIRATFPTFLDVTMNYLFTQYSKKIHLAKNFSLI